MIKPLKSLRFYIMITIFLSHLGFLCENDITIKIYQNYFSNGALGVSFFFILSGFVMSVRYKDNFKTITRNNYKEFMQRRINKIYPLYITIMIIMFIRECLHDLSINMIFYNLKRMIICIPLFQTLIPNQAIAQSFNGAAWFLSSIFILYLLTPFLLRENNKNNNIKHSLLCSVIYLIAYSLLIFLAINYIPNKYLIGTIYCSPYLRIFQYTIGIKLGNIHLNTKEYVNKIKGTNFATIMEILIIIVFILTYIYGGMFSEYIAIILRIESIKTVISYTLYTIISSLLIIILSFSKGKVSRFLSNKINLSLGRVSFSFYLIHLPIITLINDLLMHYNLFTKIIYVLPFFYFFLSLFIAYQINNYKKIRE